MTLAIVAAVGVSDIQANSATLIGTVNPEGISGTGWFEWGTTSGLGTNTPAQTLSASAWPQTIVAELTGLTPGTTYYFAAAGQTTAGTVVSANLSFTSTSATVTDPSQPGPAILTPSVTIPHVTFPLTINRTTSAVSVAEQDSQQDILSCVRMILACPTGTCPEIPGFGRPDPTFSPVPVDTAGLAAAIQFWEPRVVNVNVSQADVAGGQVFQIETFLGEETLLSEETLLGGHSVATSDPGVLISLDAEVIAQ